MLDRTAISLDKTIGVLRAVGEPTRLRLLALLSKSDLNVTDLIEILSQSQPRISRHLKLLAEAGLLERYQEGAWAYFRAADDGPGAQIVSGLLARLDANDQQIQRDGQRLEAVRNKRARQAEQFFSVNAENWNRLRKIHIDEARVEEAMLEMVGSAPVHTLLDMGTGTGRLLELFSDVYTRAIGVDTSRDMLAVARSTIDRTGLSFAQVRQGDITMLPTPNNSFDLVTIHQVLHYLDDPNEAVNEAAKALAPGGRLLIVDFAPHTRDDVRSEQAHIRLGFSHEQMSAWLDDVGLELIETRDLEPVDSAKSSEELLTVTLWLARDRRILIADDIGTDNNKIISTETI
ncbi:MAG: metalloregulator ArsR/SmtB family transcription factor [Hyphomicrobiales bacterium]|nr:metalloregulator ArsR/SmtB family transcription factor [Hyphomicrobiales bacterium]